MGPQKVNRRCKKTDTYRFKSILKVYLTENVDYRYGKRQSGSNSQNNWLLLSEILIIYGKETTRLKETKFSAI